MSLMRPSTVRALAVSYFVLDTCGQKTAVSDATYTTRWIDFCVAWTKDFARLSIAIVVVHTLDVFLSNSLQY